MGCRGFLILGGKGTKMEETWDQELPKRYYFFTTHDSDENTLDVLYKICFDSDKPK